MKNSEIIALIEEVLKQSGLGIDVKDDSRGTMIVVYGRKLFPVQSSLSFQEKHSNKEYLLNTGDNLQKLYSIISSVVPDIEPYTYEVQLPYDTLKKVTYYIAQIKTI